MTVDNINVEETVKRVTELIAAEKDLSPALMASLEVLLLLISILVNRLGLNSRKISKPPVTAPIARKSCDCRTDVNPTASMDISTRP